MYRKFEITDEEGLKEKFEVYPDENNKIVNKKSEIDMTLHTRRRINDMVSVVNDFMNGNTINKVEIEEIIE